MYSRMWQASAPRHAPDPPKDVGRPKPYRISHRFHAATLRWVCMEFFDAREGRSSDEATDAPRRSAARSRSRDRAFCAKRVWGCAGGVAARGTWKPCQASPKEGAYEKKRDEHPMVKDIFRLTRWQALRPWPAS